MKVSVIEGFIEAFLKKNFDGDFPIPDFHRDLWALCCSEDRYVAIAAPRGHGKSTAVTLAYVLTCLMFGEKKFALILSTTWEAACEFLSEVKFELKHNEEIHKVFGSVRFVREGADDLIVRVGNLDFRVMAKGSGQDGVRGLKWHGMRPDLIVGDDLEKDEQVASSDRREKFRTWLFNAVLPAGGDTCEYRIVGTVMHFDSALERLLNDPSWRSVRFQAHAAFGDFSKLLWPEKWSEQRLRAVRQQYINQNNPEGYSQEYLNYPIVAENAYFRREDMLPMMPGDEHSEKRYYAAADLAISVRDKGNFTVITVGGLDSMGFLHIVDVRRGRWSSLEIIEEILSVDKRYKPEMFAIERGHIEQTIGPFLKAEMRKRGQYINLQAIVPVGDKPARSKSFQAMHRAGFVKFDKEATWYPDLEDEMFKFTGSGAKGAYDDQVDTLAYLGMLVEDAQRPDTLDEIAEQEYASAKRVDRKGRSNITGY